MTKHLDEMRNLISLVESAKEQEVVTEGLWNKLKAHLGNLEAEHKEIFEKASRLLMQNWKSHQSKLKSVGRNNEKHPISDLGDWLHKEVGYKPKYIKAAFDQIPGLKKEMERFKQDGDDKIEVSPKEVQKAFYLMIVMADLDNEQPHAVQQWVRDAAPKDKPKAKPAGSGSASKASSGSTHYSLKDIVNKQSVGQAGVQIDPQTLSGLKDKGWDDVRHDNSALHQLAMLGLLALKQAKT